VAMEKRLEAATVERGVRLLCTAIAVSCIKCFSADIARSATATTPRATSVEQASSLYMFSAGWQRVNLLQARCLYHQTKSILKSVVWASSLCFLPALNTYSSLFDASERRWQIPGQPRLLLSAEFDYARLPRELWRERIILARLAGFNAVTIPVFWGFHEPQPSRFLFDDQRDLGQLLDICGRENMWAIVRLGPHLDGDWELGGLPPWLLARMVHPRTYDREFLTATDRWFDKVIPLLASKQIQKGGSVILIEVEANPEGKPSRVNPDYSNRLCERARSLGIEVPIVRAQNEGGNKPFAYSLSEGPYVGPDKRAVLRLGKARPWGEDDAMLDRSMEAAGLLARGARWLDCRSVFGGTNFGFQAAEGLPTCHDCGAPVGEAGDLRSSYFSLKQMLWLARGLERILAESQPERMSITAIGGQRFPAWRHSSATGEVLFVESRPGAAQSATIALGDTSSTIERIEFEPRGLWPIVRNWILSDTVTVEASAAKLFHVGRVGNHRLLVAVVSPGEKRAIRFRTTRQPRFDFGSEAFAATSGGCALTIAGSDNDGLHDFCFTAGESVHVIAASEPMFAQTWPLTTAQGNAVLIGGEALFDVETESSGVTQLVVGSTSLPAECRIYADEVRVASSRGTATFAESQGCWIVRSGSAEKTPPPPPQLGRWQQRDDNQDAQRSCDVSTWTIGSQPLTIEHLPSPTASAYVWYRTTLDVPAFSTYTLRLGGIGDRATAFVDGWCLGALDGALTDEMTFRLPSGPHVLSLLVEHDGRDELQRDAWPIPDHCFKGLCAPAVVLAGEMRALIPFWQFVINNRGPDEVRRIAFSNSTEENWQVLGPGPDDMNHQRGFAWYRFGGDPQQPRVCYFVPPQGVMEIRVPGVDDRAWVYLDGHMIGTHDDPRRGRVIRIPDTLPVRHEKTSHSLALLVENQSGPGGVGGAVQVGLTQREAEISHGPWWMRVGLTGEREGWFLPSQLTAADATWSDVTTPTRQTVVRWYRTCFEYSGPGHPNLPAGQPGQAIHELPLEKERDKIVAPTDERAETFFLHLGSLQRGVVWLNGHCLGRYRNVGYDAERGLCLPSCWLERENWIVVAETDEGLPEGLFLTRDPASYYYLTILRIEPP